MTGLASADDIAARLGRTLTDDQIVTTELLIASAEAIIASTARVDVADLDGDTMPVQRAICIEMVTRVLLNPEGFKVASETLGAYSHTGTFAGSGLLELTDGERRQIRRVSGLSTFQATTLETPYSGTALDDQPELPL